MLDTILGEVQEKFNFSALVLKFTSPPECSRLFNLYDCMEEAKKIASEAGKK